MSKQLNKEMKVKLGEVIVCECCRKEIVKEHPYQVYCSECSHKVMREKNTLAVRRFREKKKQQLAQQQQEFEEMKQRLAELEKQMEQQQVNDTTDTDTTDTNDTNDRCDTK